MALQNVVSTCVGEGTSRGNGVGEGVEEGTAVRVAIDVGCGEEPTRGEAVSATGSGAATSTEEVAVAA